MSLRPEALARAAARGPFMRVLVAGVAGSAPREPGAEMLVWQDGFEGTIGGGALEWKALARAREGRQGVERVALGPALGQCCGGAVTLVYEAFDADRVAAIPAPVWARPLHEASGMPGAVARALRGPLHGPRLLDGWLLEPVAPAPAPLWIWGAGHVGRALVSVLAPLPGFALSWADSGTGRFPAPPDGVRPLVAENPADLVALAPPDAQHIIATLSHALDLELCDRILRRGFAGLGLIGSATKAARFAARLAAMGHSGAEIARIICPIGEPALGKHPQAIAVGVAAALLRTTSTTPARRERA